MKNDTILRVVGMDRILKFYMGVAKFEKHIVAYTTVAER